MRSAVAGCFLIPYLVGMVGCASAQMPAGEQDPCMPVQGPVLERDIPGCRVGSLLTIAEAKIGRGEEVTRECAEMHVLIPQIPEPGERVLLWLMVADVESQAGLFCHGTIERAYVDAAQLRREQDRRGARNFVRSAERQCLGDRSDEQVVFPY